MKSKGLFACYDSVADVWNDPFCDNSDGSALRSFTDFVVGSAPKNSAVRDLVLYRIGSYDNGAVQPCVHLQIASALSILSSSDKGDSHE